MIIACLGDSLTEGDYGIPGSSGIVDIHEENYPYFLSRILGVEVRNFGKSGFTGNLYWKHYLAGNVDLTNVDVIVVMLGTNGGFKAEEETIDGNSFGKLIAACQKDAPQARIVLCTPPHATENPEYANCGFAEKVANGVAFIRKFAREHDLDLIDVANCPDFTAENEHIMQPNDGLHYGKVGYQTMASFIADGLKQILDI